MFKHKEAAIWWLFCCLFRLFLPINNKLVEKGGSFDKKFTFGVSNLFFDIKKWVTLICIFLLTTHNFLKYGHQPTIKISIGQNNTDERSN
jgi:hypothetical protein